MPRPPVRRRPTARALARLLLLAPLGAPAACTTWYHATEAAVAPAPRKANARVRVTRRDGTWATLTRVTVRNDTLSGEVVDPRPAAGAEGARVAVPLREVARVELRSVDSDRTALLVVGLAAGAVAAFYLFLLLVFTTGTYD